MAYPSHYAHAVYEHKKIPSHSGNTVYINGIMMLHKYHLQSNELSTHKLSSVVLTTDQTNMSLVFRQNSAEKRTH